MGNQVAVKRVLRRLRGGSQAFEAVGEDGHHYVLKCAGNPQGTRTLINEWIASQLLQQLEVSAAPARILTLDSATQEDEELCFQMGSKHLKVEGRCHFGSQFPVDPTKQMIMDLLPRNLQSKLTNGCEFGLMLVFDQWLGQTDRRQSVFVRERGSNPLALRAHFIDHGQAFAGDRWEFSDSPLYGHYVDRAIYQQFDLSTACSQALTRIQNLSEDVIYGTTVLLPPEWISPQDHAALAHLVRTLDQRRFKLPYLVEQAVKALIAEDWQSVA